MTKKLNLFLFELKLSFRTLSVSVFCERHDDFPTHSYASHTWPLTIDEELFDSQFADDTMLYVPYSEDALDTHIFCLAIGACINWTKSSGIPVGMKDDCTWGEDVGFT